MNKHQKQQNLPYYEGKKVRVTLTDNKIVEGVLSILYLAPQNGNGKGLPKAIKVDTIQDLIQVGKIKDIIEIK